MRTRGKELLRADDAVGTTIAARFELLDFVAAGGMGRVYRARDRTNGDLVALKLLAPMTGDAERFAREAALLAKIDHRGVVRYVDHGSTTDAQYLAMEWLEGEDLSDRLGAEGTLGFEETILVAERTAEALAAAHRVGIVHRDLKPANMFLVDGKFEELKLLDFGVARTIANTDFTVTGAVIGTPSYMAPEQVRGDAIGPGVDVYGLGAVLFRCLVGRPPFRGSHQLAVLAKVVIEPPPRVRELRPDVPPVLDALVARLLAKEPENRPLDGAALLDELRDLRADGLRSGRRLPAAISAREQRVACVVLCADVASEEEATIAEHNATRLEDAIRSTVETRGGALDALARGAWIVTIPNAASSAEQAARGAQCALALSALRPRAPLFVATGRVVVTGAGRVGEVIDRAAAALVLARATKAGGGVRADAATAELLDGRFRFEGDGEWRALIGEDDTVAPVRTLLGKPAVLVGREAQLAMLDAAMTACANECRAGAVLIVSPPALGKTHLVHELLRTSRAIRHGGDVLFAHGDPIRAASAFGIAAQIISRAAGMRDSDGAADRAEKLRALVARDVGEDDAARVREMFGEISGIVTSGADATASLRAARADAAIMVDALRDAWTTWISARAANGPVIVVLEDVHWADTASVQLLETATARLADRPLIVIATSRPEGSALFADRFRKHDLVELTLGPLSPAAAERLVRNALGASIDPELAKAIVRRSAGHPFHLEEIVRSVANGRGPDALPDSVLGMVQARLDELGPEARRILRAASVFGETFRAGGVRALMGDDVSERDVRTAIAELVANEVVIEERASKWRDSAAFRFRHMLLRDAAYATLAEVDRVRAHERAAVWLVEIGEPDPAVLGEHFDRGRAPGRAATFFQRAAALALQCSDFERASDHAARALRLGPDAPTEAALRAIEAEILYWRGEITAAAERAPSAIARLPRGAPAWFDAVSIACGALGQLGQNDDVATLLRDAARVVSSAESRGAHVVALCRGMTQLFWAHEGAGLPDVRACLEKLVAMPDPLDAYQTGWVHRARGESAWLHERNVARCMRELDLSCESFAAARALRPLCLSRLNAASLSGWSGDPARGLLLVASARADAERLGAGFLLSYARAVEGLLLAYSGDAAAESLMRRALEELGASPRLAFICRVVLAQAALARGDLDAAAAQTRAANTLHVVDDLRAAGLALASRVSLARGAHEDALRSALDAARVEAACADLELTHGMSALALAEAHVARGDRSAAREALAPIVRAIAEIAETIASQEQRRRFVHRPFANDRIARLAGELGLPAA